MTINRASAFTAVVAVTAALLFGVCYLFFPPSLSAESWLVFVTLLILSIISELLAVSISERGSVMTMDYVPQLGAVLLLGPTGATALTAVSWTLYQSLASTKPTIKRIFNVGQITLTVSAAGLVYVALGGTPSLRSFQLVPSLLPFAGAALVYFGLNHLLVLAVISLAENRPVPEVLHQLTHTPFVFDFAGSSLALLLAFLYVEWGLAALLATIIPIIGLRYSYGVTLQLRQLNSDLLRVLIKTIEAQDPYTSGHSVRVAEGAIALARELGLGPRERNKIETAALLHDIGKIDSAYRRILTQEDPLTDEQAELIKQHPERGVQLVQSVRSIDPDVLRYIKHHHERYDGTGYPDGLGTDSIPLGARIIMVSDSVDAMVTSRAYRDALSPSKARMELIENKGSQFDPRVVDAALTIGLIDKHMEKAKQEMETEDVEP